MGISIGTATIENNMKIPQKKKREREEPPYDPAIPLMGMYLKKTETLIGKNICTIMFIVPLFIIARIWKQPKCPSVDDGTKKILCLCIKWNVMHP